MGYRAPLSCSSSAPHASAGERRQVGSPAEAPSAAATAALISQECSDSCGSGPWTGTQQPRNGLSVSSELSSGLGPPGALQISMHAKTACHSFLILFGSSAPPLLGRGKGITDETNFFKLGEIEITTENCPFFCLAPPQHSHSSS